MQTVDGDSFVLHFPKSEPKEFRNNTFQNVFSVVLVL